MIRIATSEDEPGVIDLVDRVYREYGEKMCLEGADGDLQALNEHYFERGGCFWVLVIDATVCGSHGARPSQEASVCVFRRLYLEKSLRGTHWGHELMNVAIDWAKQKGYRKIEFWSDDRFSRAHAFFAKFGFKPDGRTRTMYDGHEPYTEHYYSLRLGDTDD